jgi:hypothetical protein
MMEKSLIYLFLITTLVSCTEPYEFYSSVEGNALVVEGSINNTEGPHVLYLSQTQESDGKAKVNGGINNPLNLVPVSNALAVLYNSLGESFQFHENENGEYIIDKGIHKGIQGAAYHVEITLSDGKQYISLPEVIPAKNSADSLNYDFQLKETVGSYGIIFEKYFIRLFVDSYLPDTDTTLYLKWDIEEVYLLTPRRVPGARMLNPACYITLIPSPQQVELFTTEGFSGREILDRQLMERKLDKSFLEKHYFNVYQQSITRSYYEYWKNIERLIENSGTIYAIPPGIVEGNIRSLDNPDESVFGYFSGKSTVINRVRTFGFDIPYYIVKECAYRKDKPLYQYPPECLDCLKAPNSTTDRPDYF